MRGCTSRSCGLLPLHWPLVCRQAGWQLCTHPLRLARCSIHVCSCCFFRRVLVCICLNRVPTSLVYQRRRKELHKLCTICQLGTWETETASQGKFHVLSMSGCWSCVLPAVALHVSRCRGTSHCLSSDHAGTSAQVSGKGVPVLVSVAVVRKKQQQQQHHHHHHQQNSG